ncbi:hypothetical protein AB4084_14230, partial [Lysobacter sp. 2RAB21]
VLCRSREKSQADPLATSITKVAVRYLIESSKESAHDDKPENRCKKMELFVLFSLSVNCRLCE